MMGASALETRTVPQELAVTTPKYRVSLRLSQELPRTAPHEQRHEQEREEGREGEREGEDTEEGATPFKDLRIRTLSNPFKREVLNSDIIG